jgi:NADH:ubiquinone oxidoreductase subunit 6 (subunit J)
MKAITAFFILLFALPSLLIAHFPYSSLFLALGGMDAAVIIALLEFLQSKNS